MSKSVILPQSRHIDSNSALRELARSISNLSHVLKEAPTLNEHTINRYVKQRAILTIQVHW